MLTVSGLHAGGCKAIVNLLKHDSTAVQDAAVFATASLMKWNLADVKRSFAHNEGECLLPERPSYINEAGALQLSCCRHPVDSTLLYRACKTTVACFVLGVNS